MNFLSGKTGTLVDNFDFIDLVGFVGVDFLSGVIMNSKSGLRFFKLFSTTLPLFARHFAWDRRNSQLVLAFEMTSSRLQLRATSFVRSMNVELEASLFLLQAIAAFRTCSVICIELSLFKRGK